MRLFLLPISNRRAFIYCDRSKTSQATHLLRNPCNIVLYPPFTTIARGPKLPWYRDLDQITARAASTWTEWEQAKVSTFDWKRRTTTLGNTLLRRIPYQEWGLKSFPPLTAKLQKKYEDENSSGTIHVLFPPKAFSEADLIPLLKTLATERQSLHRTRMFGSAIGAPLTLPFAAIPV
jgi:hypothetical protein